MSKRWTLKIGCLGCLRAAHDALHHLIPIGELAYTSTDLAREQYNVDPAEDFQ